MKRKLKIYVIAILIISLIPLSYAISGRMLEDLGFIRGGAIAGISTFLGLTDTPSGYTGKGLYGVRVNTGETALEFIDLDTLYQSYIGNITASAAEINILDGVSGVTAAELSYVGDVTGLIQAQLDLLAPKANPTFTGAITIGSAGITEPELEILDGATLSTTQINYLNAATGTTGTASTNLVFSTSPQLTTPDLGAATADSITIDASATPGWVFRDSDNEGTDKEIGKIYYNALTTTDGAEDGGGYYQTMEDGSEVTYITLDGDNKRIDLNERALRLDDNDAIWVDATADGMDDHEYNAIRMVYGLKAGEALTLFDTVFLKNDTDPVWEADATAASGEYPAFGIVIAAADDGAVTYILREGVIRDESWTGLTIGGPVYLGEADGTLTQVVPTDSNDCIQIIGWAISDSEIYFDFSRPYQLVE